VLDINGRVYGWRSLRRQVARYVTCSRNVLNSEMFRNLPTRDSSSGLSFHAKLITAAKLKKNNRLLTVRCYETDGYYTVRCTTWPSLLMAFPLQQQDLTTKTRTLRFSTRRTSLQESGESELRELTLQERKSICLYIQLVPRSKHTPSRL
jgi:hypothetical protein